MNISRKLDELHLWFRQNKWLNLFTIFTRLLLVAGFLGPGIVKISGERFTDLSNNHPMGQYLEALYHTGYYYTFIGILQVTAAILLLFPRTVVLGVLIYFPIILNICILSFAVRFDGSLVTSPLMVIANLYLLWWHYDRIKYILPFSRNSLPNVLSGQRMTTKFPFIFFSTVAVIFLVVIALVVSVFDVKPKNTISECNAQFEEFNALSGCNFCDCIHNRGLPLDTCLKWFQNDQFGYQNPDDI